MPIIKANEPLPESPVVIGIYGEPGAKKTSIANTAEKPLLIDFDRGSRRSLFRKDTLVMKSWNDVMTEEKAGTFKDYKTIIIDTAKAALDDFLMAYVVEKDFKMRTNKLQAYGAIGDEFKLFLNSRRNEGADVIIIAHAKKDEDTKKQIPDVTGQSYQLMIRVCDQLGFVSMINNKASIAFNPTDVTVGKNTAGLPAIEIPDKDDPAIHTFMQDIIRQTKEAMARESAEQLAATEKSKEFQDAIAAVADPATLTKILVEVKALPDYLRIPLEKVISAKAKEKGYVGNKETKAFELAAPPADKKPEDATPPAVNDNNAIATSTLDQRSDVLASLGMVKEGDGVSGYELHYDYEALAAMNEDDFMTIVETVQDKYKASTKKVGGKKKPSAAAA